MMAHKHLHDLLKEDQEPFLLKKYISDRRSQLKRPSPSTSLQLQKPKSIYHNSNFPAHFCKNACFFSFRNTPDLLNSPLMEFASPANCKSPCKSPNAIFLHIPARTAALLLEAALRIHKHSSSSKPKSHNKTNGFGLFGSFFKRLTQRNRKREIQGVDGVNGSRKQQERIASEKGKDSFHLPCSNNGRPCCAVWSETNEDKSLDTETSSSSLCLSDESYEIDDFVSKHKHVTDCACCDDSFCESPFRFVLQRSPSSGSRTPELASPASSPSRHRIEDKGKNGAESVEKFQSGEEEEEKEQCSPVSVLDPPFEDDEDGHENDDEDDGCDLECSYAIVQRAKQQLLYKLRSFEKLAELDPTELEKRMIEQEDEDDETSDNENDLKGLVLQVLCQSSFHDRRQIPRDLKRLVSDLIMEEERELNSLENREMVIRRVCERLELWKEVDSSTIDMMIEQDFCRENGKWKKNEEHIKEVAGELELAIFGLLVEEFSEELVC